MPREKINVCGIIIGLNLLSRLEHAHISQLACSQVIHSAKWIDCEWKAEPPLSVAAARIVDSSDGSILETVSLNKNSFVNFTGLRLAFEKEYKISVRNAVTTLKLLSELHQTNYWSTRS